jgi:hypothetical protein
MRRARLSPEGAIADTRRGLLIQDRKNWTKSEHGVVVDTAFIQAIQSETMISNMAHMKGGTAWQIKGMNIPLSIRPHPASFNT